MKLITFLFGFTFLLLSAPVLAQNHEHSEMTMSFEEYEPTSTLIIPGEEVVRAKYPYVDVHSHLWRMATMDLNQTVGEMDSLNLQVLVNLSGRSGEQLAAMAYAPRKLHQTDSSFLRISILMESTILIGLKEPSLNFKKIMIMGHEV